MYQNEQRGFVVVDPSFFIVDWQPRAVDTHPDTPSIALHFLQRKDSSESTFIRKMALWPEKT